jgi:hypothetical protein
VESGHRKSRLEHVLLTGLAQAPVGVEPTFMVTRTLKVEWTVVLKLLSTNPEKGYGYIKLKFGKPVIKDTFLYHLSKIGAAVAAVTVANEKPMDITDPAAGDWPNDVYLMKIPDAAGASDFDRIMIGRVGLVANLMRTKNDGMIPKKVVDGWVVFTVNE